MRAFADVRNLVGVCGLGLNWGLVTRVRGKRERNMAHRGRVVRILGVEVESRGDNWEMGVNMAREESMVLENTEVESLFDMMMETCCGYI